MPNINSVLTKLNLSYSEITDLIPNLYRFRDDMEVAYDEYDILCYDVPIGDVLYRLSNGKLLWGGISGADSTGGYNLRRYNADYTLDTSWNPITFDQDQNNGFVRDIGEQSSGKLIVVGHFDDINSGTSVGKIMRLNSDGTYDSTFNNGGAGFNGNALVVKVLDDDSIIVGGTFSTYNGNACESIIKLNSDGSVDGGFTPTLSTNVYAIEVDSNDDIYVGGDFSGGLVRLDSDGTTDLGFNVGTGFDNRVTSLIIDSNGKVVVGGWFTSYNGNSVPQVIRLETSGSVDGNFQLDGNFDTDGNNESVMCMGLQSNGKIVVGGWFWTLDGNPQSKLVRLNSDGTKDTTFDIGDGFNLTSNWYNGSRINDLLINADGTILVTGNIQAYQNSPINAFARLSSTGVLNKSNRLLKYNKVFGINDGGGDMYDSGNSINTDLTQLFDNIKDGNVDFNLGIPYTHTTAQDDEAFDDPNNNDISLYEPLKDGEVKSGTDYFGSGSSYFTNMYPGMLVMAASDINITEFSISGGLGSDSDTDLEATEVEIGGSTYACFMKTNIEGDSGSDPTVNHIILVPGTLDGLTHLTNVDEDDYDDDCVQGLSGRDHIYYILFSTWTDPAEMVSFETCQMIAEKFLELVAKPEPIKGCNMKCKQQNIKGFGCKISDTSCGCAQWRYMSGGYVPAITVCNLRLF